MIDMPKEWTLDSEMPTGVDLLHDPMLNQGTAFTEEERDAPGSARSAAAAHPRPGRSRRSGLWKTSTRNPTTWKSTST